MCHWAHLAVLIVCLLFTGRLSNSLDLIFICFFREEICLRMLERFLCKIFRFGLVDKFCLIMSNYCNWRSNSLSGSAGVK